MGNTVSTLGGAMESEITRSYNSLSGTDIRAVIGHTTFAEIQAISYSIHREKAPIYTMGSPDPRAYSRAKRGVAGSLIWINFDRHALLNLVRQEGGQFVANKDDIRPEFQLDSNGFIGQAGMFSSALVRDSSRDIAATIGQLDTQLSTVSGFKEAAAPWYSDQILPFDGTLAGTNEMGAAATMKVFGVCRNGWAHFR